jgi:acetoin utilization deacetylase AcuC-like enzyme
MTNIDLGELSEDIIQSLEEKYLLMAHTKEYVAEVKKSCGQLQEGRGFIDQKRDIYLSSQSYQAALLSAYSAVKGVESILEGKHERGYCITRPPGHHAKCGDLAGFCVFNNIAIAAEIAKEKG